MRKTNWQAFLIAHKISCNISYLVTVSWVTLLKICFSKIGITDPSEFITLPKRNNFKYIFLRLC